jgi:polar amino acid transport system substrate-binding protein
MAPDRLGITIQTQKNGNNLAGKGRERDQAATDRPSGPVCRHILRTENKRFLTTGGINLGLMGEDRAYSLPRFAGRVRRRGWAVALALAVVLAPSAIPAQPVPAARPQQLQVIGAARPPYIIESNGLGTGPAIELLQILARRVGADPTVRILPFQRALMALEQGNTLYPALLRTPQRENRFIWIGEVYVDRAVFFTRRDKAPIGSLAAARELARVSVMRGSELQGMLQSFGLEDFETTNSEIDNARLLHAGRIDGWFALRAVGRATWAQLQFDPAELQAGEAFATVPFWIAGSADLPEQTVAALRAAYRATRADGRYRRIIAPLLALEDPQ